MAMTSALSRLGVVAHKGAWNNFPQCFDALPEGSDAIHSNAVIVLGGWMLQPPTASPRLPIERPSAPTTFPSTSPLREGTCGAEIHGFKMC
jgi:hypothetical protein